MIFGTSARLGFWLLCLGVFVGIETLDRLILLVWSAVTNTGLTVALLPAIPIGLVEDASTGLVLGLPFLACLYLCAGWLRRPRVAWVAHVVLVAMLGVLISNEIAEMFFWNEFDSRFNGIAVNYLIFPREVIGNIRESFDVSFALPAVAAMTAALYWPLRRRLNAALASPLRPGEARRSLAVGIGAAAVGLAVLYLGPFSAGENREVNEIAMNGMHSLLRAALTNDQKYDGLYLGMPEAEASHLARALVAQDNTRFLDHDGGNPLLRRVDNGDSPKRLNVVLVIEESFGSVYVDGLDNATGESISPNLERLARDGLLFTNVYATGNRTVRGLEALLTSFPPIPGISTTRRSGSEGMNSLPFLLKRHGYATAFLYGGRAAFDNMAHFWSTIGFDKVWDQSDIADQGFTTIWGVADEFLFGEALKRLDTLTQQGQPVFLGLLTVSNHRPYLYPDGRIDRPAAQKRRENSASYADWAFGDFVARARGHAWFKDTVFVFIGDHGPRVFGAAQVPAPSYRVPLLFYAPAHIAPQRNAAIGSSMDMAPTLLGLLGISFDSPFFGVDLRRVPADGGRVAMDHNFSVAFGDGRHIAILAPGMKSGGYAMAPGPQPLRPEAAADPQTLAQAIALTQTAHRLFYARQYHELSAASVLGAAR